jgi:hypothetical protein
MGDAPGVASASAPGTEDTSREKLCDSFEGSGRHSSSSSSSSPSISTTSASSRARFFDWVRGGEAEEEAEEEEEDDLILGNLAGVAREEDFEDFEEEDEPEREDPAAARFLDPRLAAAKIEAVDDMISEERE